MFQDEQLKRIFTEDYTTDKAAVPEIVFGKIYSAIGTDGQTYNRMALMPNSTHAYYLVTQDAIDILGR